MDIETDNGKVLAKLDGQWQTNVTKTDDGNFNVLYLHAHDTSLKEPLNKSVFLLAKSEVGRFFSHRFEKFGFWLMNPRYLLPFWGFPHAADGLLPSCQ